MKEFKTIDDILDFAIGEEEGAQRFYESLAASAESSGMREVFEGFAREERGHKARLEAIRKGQALEGFATGVQDLKLGDYLVDVDPTPETSYQEPVCEPCP